MVKEKVPMTINLRQSERRLSKFGAGYSIGIQNPDYRNMLDNSPKTEEELYKE
jgi:hypothetical protein